MACTRISITGKAESILFNTVYEKIAKEKEQLADEMFSHFKSELFKKDFGDFVDDYNNNKISDRTDENGEPKLFYNETAKKYYYLNKDNEKVFFPLINRGLRSIWNYDQINRIKSRLALSYFKGSGLDFNNINFEEAKSLPNLKNFVLKQVQDKVKSLEDEGEYFSSLSLEESLNHLDELVENVENFFKEMNLEFVEDEEDNTSLIEEEGKDPIFNQHSAERSTKKSVSTNVKLRLSLLEDKTNLDPIWNEPTFLSRDVVYSALQGVLCEEIALPGEDIFDLHKDALNRILPKKPFLSELHGYLNSPTITEDQKSEFSQAFNLIKNNHIVTQYSIEKNGNVTHKTIQISDTGSKSTTVKEQWDENFRGKFLNQNNQLKEGSLERLNKATVLLKSLNSKIETLKKEVKKEVTDKEQKQFEELVNESNTYLKTLGLETTEEGLQVYLDNYGKDISLEDMIKNLQTLVEQTQYVVTGVKTKYESKSESYNTFISLSQTFSKLAGAEAYMLSEGSDATILTGGKQKWIYSYPSYLSTTIKQWKKKPELLIRLYKSGQYTLGSYYMGVLSGSIDIEGRKKEYNSKEEQIEVSRKLLDKIDLGIMNQMTSNGEFEVTAGLSYNDYMIDYINKVISGDFTRTTTQADKTTELQTKIGLNVSSYNGLIDGKLQLTKKVKSIFSSYFYSELNRQLEAENEVELAKLNPKENKLTPHYHYKYGNEDIYDKSGNAFKSQYFENLSVNSKNQTDLEKQVTDLLYTNNKLNFKKFERGLDPQLDELFDSYLEENFHKRWVQTLSYLQESDILKRNEEDNIVPNKIDSKLLETQYRKVPELQKAYAVASDFMVNGLIQNIEFSKMFSGDVAYYKNMVDYKKRVPATYTDGLQLRVNEWNETFKIATIKSIMRKSPFYDKLVESLGEYGAKPYSNINSADAQAWITPKRWKFLIKALGKWTTGADSHESVYHKMMDESSKEMFYTEKELKLAAQPLKGVYFYRDKQGKPVYLKYSQAVLSQALVKGSDIEKLFNKMNSNKIDEVITFDGVKVGSIEPTEIHDENGNIKDDFELNPQLLYNRGWKLQQDLPTKTYKDLDVGSQIQKNIFQGLIHNKINENFLLDNKLVSGQYVIDEIVKIVTGLTNEGLTSLKQEFKIEDDFKIGNISGFYKALIGELRKRGGSENVIKALQAETSIVGIPQSAGKIYNIFASVMNSRLIKIKTNGGSFIQMANFGFNKTEATSQGVRWNPLAEETTSEPVKYIHPETLKETIKPGSVLISGAFLAKYVPNWRKYSDKDLFGYNDENGKLIEGIIDSKILNNIIGYRIPNQGLASNDALRIAGILPEASGDTIVAYTGITTKTGSDYDVDKMYVMFPSYSLNKETKKLEYINYDSENVTKKGLQNRLIELYKSVLTNPEVYPSVMKPIDIDFIEKELNSLFPDKSSIFMNSFDPEVDAKLRYSFLGGKAGVGQEANAMVDISREGNLSLLDVKNILWGHHNDLKESKFDNEYSEELSEEDLNYYVSTVFKKDAKKEDVDRFANELKKVKVGDSLTAILNAFVDIAKDPYISKGNWTMTTTNVGNMLLRLGAHPLYVVNFLANPIIKQYIDFQKSKESLTSEKDSGNDIELLKKQIVINALNKDETYDIKLGNIYKDYFSKLNVDWKKDRIKNQLKSNEIDLDKYNEELEKINKIFEPTFKKLVKQLKVSEEEMKSIIKNLQKQHEIAFNPNTLNIFDRESNQWNKYKLNLEYFRDQNMTKNPDINFQINLLNTFKELQEYSKNIRENVLVSKLDTDGMGKSHNDLFALFNLKQQINDKLTDGVKGSIKGFETKFKGTTLEAYFNSLKWVKNVVESNPLLFPTGTEQVQDIFNEISNDLYNSKLTNSDLVNNLSKEYNTYLLNKIFEISNSEAISIINDLPKRINDFKSKNEGKYYLLDELNIKLSKNDKYHSTISLSNRKKSSSYETLFTNSWKDLMIDNPGLAEDLIKYSFITSGFQMTTNQFFTYIPSEYFIQNDINEKINNIVKNEQYDFVDKFYLNNLTNKKIVKFVFENNLYNPFNENTVNFGKESYNLENGFVTNKSDKAKYYVELNKKPNINAPIDEKQKSNYYKLAGYNNVGQSVYVRVNEITNKLNDKDLQNYNDYDELVNDEILKLKSLVIYDRQKSSVIPETYQEEEFDLNSLNYGSVEEVKQDAEFLDNIKNSKTMSDLREMFNSKLMLIKFNESNIYNVEELDKLSEDELGELLKKICK